MMMKVKPLEWENFGTMAHIAKAPLFGRLRVEQFGRNDTWTVGFSVPGYSDTFLDGEWQTPEEAKAAAQADYEARIMAALEPDTDLSAALIKAALERASGLCNKSILNGGMAQSVAMFVEADHHKIYRDAAENYAEKISKIANDPSEIDSIIKKVMGE